MDRIDRIDGREDYYHDYVVIISEVIVDGRKQLKRFANKRYKVLYYLYLESASLQFQMSYLHCISKESIYGKNFPSICKIKEKHNIIKGLITFLGSGRGIEEDLKRIKPMIEKFVFYVPGMTVAGEDYMKQDFLNSAFNEMDGFHVYNIKEILIVDSNDYELSELQPNSALLIPAEIHRQLKLRKLIDEIKKILNL